MKPPLTNDERMMEQESSGKTGHTSGCSRYVPANVIPPSVPSGGLDLEDDTPLAGGSCNVDGCESCQ